MIANLGPGHWAVLAAVAILLFGAKKLPEASHALGKSMRILRSEVRELHAESESDASTNQSAA